MTTIRADSALGMEPRDLAFRLFRGADPLGLVATGVTRRSQPEFPVVAGLHPGPRPSRPVAPHREELCPAWLRHTHVEIIGS
jgi:hypothetical protein